jgi:hypothetical protein
VYSDKHEPSDKYGDYEPRDEYGNHEPSDEYGTQEPSDESVSFYSAAHRSLNRANSSKYGWKETE